MNAAALITAMALVTMGLRAAPFLVFRKKVPAFVSYLGEVLPPAIIGMLVIFCLKDVSVLSTPHGIPELIAIAAVVGTHIWKRNAVISILAGTVIYMVLIRLMEALTF